MATTRLRVGSLVFSNDFRHQVVLAKEAATLDVLSDGRFELGLGSGWLREEYDQAGIHFDAPGRIERLAEKVPAIVEGVLRRRAGDAHRSALRNSRAVASGPATAPTVLMAGARSRWRGTQSLDRGPRAARAARRRPGPGRLR